MAVKKLKWCDFCRDPDPDIGCADDECNKSFHRDCIRLNGESFVLNEETDEYEYYCENCQDAMEDDDHDDKCYMCKRREKITADLMNFTKCSSCPKVFHLRCLGLQREVEDDTWQCPSCRPEMNTVQVRLKGIKKQKIGNVQICYVCQQGGRLLGCAACPQSYHPKCIDGDLLKDMSDEWNCPLCRGLDPLRHMQHRRLDRDQRREMSKKRQSHINKLRSSTKLNRDIFLYAQRNCIRPFVDESTMARLKRIGKSHKQRSSNSYHKIDVAIFDQLEQQLKENGDVGFRSILNEGVQLKPYQVYGVCWMLNAFEHKAGAILADEMGLGKTIQTLAFLSVLRAKGIEGPHLIVVPLSTVGNWVREIQKFTSHLSVTKICGSKAERVHAMEEPVAREGCVDVYITTYETVATEEWFFTDHFKWCTIILDEAHRIKSEKGAVRHSLDRIETSFRILLTGTPLQNNVKELHTLLNFLFPDILRSGEEFEKAFSTGQGAIVSNPKAKSKQSDIEQKKAQAEALTTLDIDESRMQAVCELLQLLMLRRTKAQVVDLPPKEFHDVWLPLNKTQIQLYRGLLDLSEADISEGKVKKIIGTMIKMRLTCSHPTAAIQGHEAKGTGHQSTKAKLALAHEYATYEMGRSRNQIFKSLLDEIESLSGEDHIHASSKLLFLDKLLQKLHSENMSISNLYTEEYLRNAKNTKAKGAITAAQVEDIENQMKPMIHSGDDTLFSSDTTPYVFESGHDQKHWSSAAAYKRDYEKFLDKRKRVPRNASSEENAMLMSTSSAEEDDIAEEEDNGPVETKTAPKLIHKVLIFSQFKLVLSELERYLKHRGFKYMRLDGSTNKMIRELDIREFNDANSTHLVYLIGTRAGGMGINLVTANHVVLFDEDWNPFVDLQAIDRAHRIGQRRRVHVWKLMTEWTVEERMAFRRAQKMKLDSKLIKARAEKAELELNECEESHEKLGLDDVKKLLVYGSEAIRWLDNRGGSCEEIDDLSINDHLKRERTAMPEDVEVEAVTEVDEGIEDEVDNEDQVEVNTDESDTESRVMDPSNGIIGASNTGNDADEDTQEESVAEGGRRRGTRIRRPTQVIYQPILHKETRARNPIRSEERCFICQDKEYKKTLTVRSDGKNVDTTEDNNDEGAAFIKCNTCPKVYHVGECLGMPPENKDRRNFRCQWHECSVCYRKSSQAGGLLIHCATCPTSFCFDCFPPEYRRYWPDPMYYENLVARGFNCSADNFITYLCSRCKAMEQQKRRSLLDAETLKAELAAERAEQKRLKDDEKRAKDEARKERENKAKAKNEEKELKRLARVEREQERRLALEEKVKLAHDIQHHADLSAQLQTNIDRLFPSECHALYKETLALLCWSVGQGPLPKPLDSKIRTDLTTAHKDVIDICGNCLMPLHKTSECPWPPDVRKISHYLALDHVQIDEKGIPHIPENTKGKYLFNNYEWAIREEDKVIEIDLPTVPENIPEELSKDVYKKKMTRGYCSYCGVSSREHTRRHCPKLMQIEKDTYARHKHDLGSLVLNLETYCEQFQSRLPNPPNLHDAIAMKANIDKDLNSNISPKLDPRYLVLAEKAKEVWKYRNHLNNMVSDYVRLVATAIKLHHIDRDSPGFTPFHDQIFDAIKCVSKTQRQAMYARGKKRAKPEEGGETDQKLKRPKDEGGTATPMVLDTPTQPFSTDVVIDLDDDTPPVSSSRDLLSSVGPQTDEALFNEQ